MLRSAACKEGGLQSGKVVQAGRPAPALQAWTRVTTPHPVPTVTITLALAAEDTHSGRKSVRRSRRVQAA